MVVYLDLLFLFNFLLNFVFIYVIEILYREKCGIKKMFFGGLVGGLLVFCFLFDYLWYQVCKIGGGALIGLTGFKKNRCKQTIIKIISFYILNFVSVGFVAVFNIRTWYLLCFILGAIIVLFFLENNKKAFIFMNEYKYNISVSSNKKSFRLQGYLDTGNFSKCDDLPLIYLSNKYHHDFAFHKLIMINTVSGSTCLACYKPRSFTIEIEGIKVRREVLIVFTEIKEFECLLNVELLL
ncbi:MAG: hypothetical protein GX661_05435 [Acholeplasmataceae bacterium]|nr:hypothetical protein [Acholeplasmataceae bacterium]